MKNIDEIISMRIALRLTQAEVAKMACIGLRTYNRYESKKRETPRPILELLTLKLESLKGV